MIPDLNSKAMTVESLLAATESIRYNGFPLIGYNTHSGGRRFIELCFFIRHHGPWRAQEGGGAARSFGNNLIEILVIYDLQKNSLQWNYTSMAMEQNARTSLTDAKHHISLHDLFLYLFAAPNQLTTDDETTNPLTPAHDDLYTN
jgi:hypothetical protein